MKCLLCGHDVNEHDGSGCNHGWVRNKEAGCMCLVTEADCLRAAQRTEAISHLRAMGKLCLSGGIMGEYQFYRMAIQQAIAAYQAVGILKPDKE